MALFEVFIPANTPDGLNITARVRADSWIQALRSGLSRLGDTADVHNVLCDIREDGIEVTEPTSGRVFRIRELPEELRKPMIAPVGVAAAAPAPAAAPTPTRAAPPAAPARAPTALAKGAERFAGGAHEDVGEERAKAHAPVALGRPKSVPGTTPDDLVTEIVEATGALYDYKDAKAAAAFVLDLAMKVVPCESGSAFIADINGDDLYFAAARGPKAADVMKFRVHMGQGIVGFCAQTGVSLAVSDVQRDPRFYAAISQKLGYQTTSILCAPAQHEGRVFGALQLINRKNGSAFQPAELHALGFLAKQFGEYLNNAGQAGD